MQWQRAAAEAVRQSGGPNVRLRAAPAAPESIGRGVIRLHRQAARQLDAAEGEVVAIERFRRVPAAEPLTVRTPRAGSGRPGDDGAPPAADAQARRPRPSASASLRAGQPAGDGPVQAGAPASGGVAFGRVTIDDALPVDAAAIDGLLRRAAGVGLGEPIVLRVTPVAQALAVRAQTSNGSPHLKSSELAAALQGIVVGPGSFVQPWRGQLLRVTGVTPEGPARIDAATLVQVSEEEEAAFTDTGVWYEDIGGLDAELVRIREIVELPLLRPDLFRRHGVVPPKGVLLHGAPGAGKTLLARAVANECRANFQHINGPDLMHKFYGESEQRLKQLFEDAAARAPSIIFIDEIDAIAPKRAEVLGEVEKRVVAQFLALMDGFVGRGQVIVIGATNLPQALDPALRRPGRFDREIEIGQPDRLARLQILRIHTRHMPLAPDVDLSALAGRAAGFVGADLESLCQEAGMAAIRRLTSGGDGDRDVAGQVGAADFAEAFHAVEPSAARDIVRERSGLTFSAVGGYEPLKRQLRTVAAHAGMARGVLLQGPSGVGKTLLARALAGELDLPLVAVDGPLLYSKWLGESEKALAEVFAKARHNAPCLLLLDQLEAIGDSRLEQMQRMVGQLVRELDEMASFPDVLVVAATNRPELIDPAVKRRFDYVFDVPLPNELDRAAIWRLYLPSAMPGTEEALGRPAGGPDAISPARLAARPGLTGAGIAAAARRARLAALARAETALTPAGGAGCITMEDLEEALRAIPPDFRQDSSPQ